MTVKTLARPLIWLVAIFGLSFGGAALIRAGVQPCSRDTGVESQVLTDKQTYAPGATMRVKLLVTNTEAAPLYLFRSTTTTCGATLGYFSLLILDDKGHVANSEGCGADAWPLGQFDAVKMLTDPTSGVRLAKSEIWGFETIERAPTKRGMYRLKAELIAPLLTKNQLQALSTAKMRAVTCSAPAPILTFMVK